MFIILELSTKWQTVNNLPLSTVDTNCQQEYNILMDKQTIKKRNKIAYDLKEQGYSLADIAEIFKSLSTREGVRKAIMKHLETKN